MMRETSASAESASGIDQIGARVKRLRGERDITLDALAKRTGFSKGYLSRIENGKKTPPLGTWARVAEALEVQLGALLQQRPRTEPATGPVVEIVRAKERPRVVRGASAFGYDYVSLANTQQAMHMQPLLFTFPKEIEKFVFFEHEGEEFMYILSGRVEWQIGHEKHVLETGDSLYFDSRLPHRGRALDGEASALVVVYTPATTSK